MPKRIYRSFIVALVLTAVPLIAWGPNGHRTVGSIADNLIAGTNAAKQAGSILGSNLRTAAVWADCAKGVNTRTFKYEGEGTFTECAVYENPASEKLMEEFVRRNVGNCISPPKGEVCHKQYHYTDMAIQQSVYAKGRIGTSDHDVVSAISAAISVLQDNGSPAPFKIAGKKEALRLLVHYVGDIHQPLHVASVYVDATGHVVDPDKGTFNPRTETNGGNHLLIGGRKLHAEWDSVDGPFAFESPNAAVLTRARAIPLTPGPVSGWSTIWATETLLLGKQAFDGITYSSVDSADRYQISLPAGYNAMKAQIQRDQVTKGGARLAQILKSLWPD